MLRNRIRRAAAAAALIATLTLAAPAQAGSLNGSWIPGIDTWQTAWAWLAKVWTRASASDKPAERGDPGLAKGSGGIGSDGTASTSTTPSCETNCERSGAIDPNG